MERQQHLIDIIDPSADDDESFIGSVGPYVSEEEALEVLESMKRGLERNGLVAEIRPLYTDLQSLIDAEFHV